MPDFTVDTQLTTPQEIKQAPLPDNYKGYTPMDIGAKPKLDAFSQFVVDGNKNQPLWMQPQSLRMQNPVKTRLDQTLRYTDPDLGFNPNDKNLEDEYAQAHPFKTFGNNILQGGARFLGAATEAIATIPLAINAVVNHDFSKLYDNELTNGINDWLKTLDTSLPVYQSNYERDNPVLKYLNPFKLGSFTGAIGGAINNLGFMAGAIAGSIVEDAAITAITGGAGLFPALAGNANFITKLGRASRAVATEPEEILSLVKSTAVNTERELAINAPTLAAENAAIRSTGEDVASTGLNAQDVLTSAKTKEIKQAINNNAQYYKIRDAAKYNLALLSSGMSIGAFQASEIYKNGVDQLTQRYFELNGKVPEGDDLQNITKVSKESANIAMGANVALTYLTARLNFGSLFKPTNQVFDEAITGWGKNIATNKVERSALDAVGKFNYSVVTKTPESTIGKLLLNGRKIGSKTALSTLEGLQFGAMGGITEASMDYNLRKYDAQSRGEVINYMDSFLKGMDNSFSTNEGFSNVMVGFVVGAFGSPLLHKITAGRGQLGPKEQMDRAAKLLNSSQLKGTMENSIQEAAVQTSLATEHKQSVDAQDTFTAKNVKMEMLYNWVTSGIKANSYDKRIEELDAARNLEGKSFESYWGKKDTPQNREAVNSYLDTVKAKAELVKDNYTKIDRLTRNPYDSEKQPKDYQAYESYKDQLALNLSKSEDYQARIKAVRDSLQKISPGLDIQNAVDMTSIDGLRNILRKLNKATNVLGKQMQSAESAGTDGDVLKEMHQKHQALSDLFGELQPLVTQVPIDKGGNVLTNELDGAKYVQILQKLYDLHSGADFTTNKYLDQQKRISDGNTIHIEETAAVKDHDTLAENLTNLQDLYKLSEANLNVQRHYNYLRQGKGADEYMSKLQDAIHASLQALTGKDGEIKTPEQIKNEIEEDIRFDFGEPIDIEEATKQERDTIAQAAKKIVVGEELTSEEQHLADTKPSRFANEVKIQQTVKSKVEEKFGSKTSTPSEDTVNNTKQTGTTTNDLFGMFSQDKSNAVQFRSNLYKAIFQSGADGVFNNLKATFETSEQSEVKFTNIPNTQFYRKSPWTENIKIVHNGEQIGILRPADSVWLDNTGTRSVYDMTEAEYVQATGNDKTTYKTFMDNLRSYQEAYNNFKAEMIANPNKEFTYEDINKHFDLSINTGSAAQNRFVIQQVGNTFKVVDPKGAVVKSAKTKEEALNWMAQNNNKLSRLDTLLKNLKYKPKGTGLISVTDVVKGGKGGQISYKSTDPVIANKDEFTPAQLAKLQLFIEANKDFLRSNINRYAVIVPMPNGEYEAKGIVFARNADATTENRTEYFDQIKNAANGTLTGDALNEGINDLNDKYFVANNDRTVKQTFITTTFFEDGDFILSVNNPSLKVFKDITVPKEQIQNTKSYEELISLLQSRINSEAQKDAGFAKLQVDLTEDSLKRQVPADKKITKLKQVEDVLKLATTDEIFKNFNINFSPKGEADVVPVEPPKAPIPTPKDQLPSDLKFAKPRYSYKENNFKLNFASDIDKAAYITAQTKKSLRDADYLKFAMEATGLTEPEVRQLGADIRSKIKEQAKTSTDEELTIGKVYAPKVVQPDPIIEEKLQNNVKISDAITSDSEEGQLHKIDITNNDKSVGSISAINDGTYLTVNQADVTTPRQGIGIEAYRQLAEQAKTMGSQLRSDSIKNRLTDAAKGLWDKLVQNGEAIKGEDHYTYTGKEEIKPTEEAKSTIENLEEAKRNTLQESLDKPIPTKVDPEYIRSGLNEVIKDGTFSEAIRNEQVSVEKAKQILDYFNVKQSKFKSDFEYVAGLYAEEAAALTAQELDFINILKANQDSLKGITSYGIKDALNSEDYRTVIDQVKSAFVDDLTQAKSIFNNEDIYNAFKKLTGTKDGDTNVENLLNKHKDKFDPIPEPAKPEVKYVTYKEAGPNDTIVERYGRVIENNGLTSEVEDARGNITARITSGLKDATKEQFDSQKTHVPTAKYIVGDKVLYGGDKQQFTIIDSEQRPREDGKTFDTFYNTEEGLLISEAGITDMARQTAAIKDFKIRAEHQKRFNVLKRISGRFEKLFPQIKTEIGYYDFNAPARFNKGKVEINIGYADKRYTQEEINMFQAHDANNVPWLKRESVAHEYMHPFVVALAESNSTLYESLSKEIAKDSKTMAQVDKLIKEGTYHEAERTNEALAIYLGKEITKAFNKDGTLNEHYVAERKNNLIKRFVNWLHDVLDYLTGKKKIVPVSEFVQRANSDAATQRESIAKEIKNIDALDAIHKKDYKSDVTKTVAFIKRTLGDALESDGSINQNNYEAGRKRLADALTIQTEEKPGALKATIFERPELNSPVYKTNVNGEDRFIQREQGNNFDTWNEVKKSTDGFWDNFGEKDGFLGFTKEEALKNLSSEQKSGKTIDPNKLDDIIESISDYVSQKATGRFEFIERVNINDGVEFDQEDLDHIKVYVDPTVVNEVNGPSTLQMYAGRITDNDAAKEFTNLVQRNYYKAGNNIGNEQIGVKALNPLMRLQDVSDYIVKGLADADVKIEYDPIELQSIDELTAYMDLSEPDAKRIREDIVKRLKLLRDTADVRLSNETLKQNYNIINRLNLDETDADFVLKYVQQGAISINLAWRKFNELREDLKDPTLTKAKLNRLNKDLDVIKQLTSFYDDFNSLYNKYDDEFATEDIIRFNKATANLNRLRDDMRETSINLAVKWFMPYVTKHNEFIKKEGYTDAKYQLTEKDLANNFRYGTAKDTNFITFNLGATVTSRDPVNAIFSNIVADMLSVNNVHIVNTDFEINQGYANFLKSAGIGTENNKAQQEFYKKNYLRDVDILTSHYDEATGTYTDKYIKKAAFHQEFYFDKYDKDLAEQKLKYANPRSGEEAEAFELELTKWKEDRKFGKSEQYRNHAYTALQSDPFFKLLEAKYNESNVKYGEYQLQYGIIPQKYDTNIVDRFKNFFSDVKEGKTTKDKFHVVTDKIRMEMAGIKKDQTKVNLDDTVYRSINSNLNKLKDDKNVSFDLHNTIVAFVTEATNYGALKEVQYNAENLRMLIEGNAKFSIPARKIGKEDFEAKIRQPIQLRKAKERLAELRAAKDRGETIDEDLYTKLTDKVAKGIQPTSLWDKFSGTIKPSETGRLNEQLRQFINDSFYGESVEEAKLGNMSLNKAASYLSMYTSINNMAFNTVAGVSNIVVGDAQMLIESQGGKYYNKAELAKAAGDYIKNIPNYIADLKNPIKSKDTQLSFLLDAIQGEVLDEFGNRISGNIAKRMFNPSSLFLFTSLGEHQIQITGMKAMLNGRKVTLADGTKISLYDAFVKDVNNRYSLRKDIKDFNEDDLQHFIRQLHSVNRSLNGNYSALHKGTLQRKWYGTLALKFRKYIYESFRTRYASEHTDYEKNTVDTGYLRYFFKDYLYGNFKKLALRQATNFKGENLKPHEKYALRKATLEVGIYAGISVLIAAMFGGKDKKELSTGEKALLLYSLRLRNDLGMYHAAIFSEIKQQSQNPTASMTTLVALTSTLGQLLHPTETYKVNGNNHKAGDSKLGADVKKLVPILSKFPINIDNKLSYFNLINQNVEGVKRNPNAN